MPLNLNVGLGPFRYTQRLDGKGTGTTAYWLFIGWWWLPLKWMIIGFWWICVLLYRAAVWAVEAARDASDRHQHPVVPPGWYPDPGGAPCLRWWDGSRWTGATR